MAMPSPQQYMSIPQVWIRSVDKDGPWNGDSRADPSLMTGGIPVPNWQGQAFFGICQGDNGNMRLGLSPGTQFSPPPPGYYPGMPAKGGGQTAFDPDKLYGDCVLQGDELQLNAAYGACQTKDGWKFGSFYIEVQCVSHDLFADFLGGGFGYEYPGLDYNFWANNCTYNAFDVYGGCGVISDNIGRAFILTISSCGTPIKTLVPMLNNTIIGLAISIAPWYTFYPASLEPVTLPCSPCCTLQMADAP